MAAFPWGSFALVSYVPDPLGASLDNFRHSLPGSDRTQSHITILPPRPLLVEVAVASEHAALILADFSPFEVELDGVSRFPLTNVLYLGLSAGNTQIRDLHRRLNAGVLSHNEEFDFQPHLTLGGPGALHLAAETEARTAWNRISTSKRFYLDEIVGLWAAPDTHSQESWTRIWSYSLSRGNLHDTAAATGRTS